MSREPFSTHFDDEVIVFYDPANALLILESNFDNMQ